MEWRFSLASPAAFVLAFLNEEYDALCTEAQPLSDAQAAYFHEVFSRGNGSLLRDMIEHVLMEGYGADPAARLAAYAYANEMTDLSPLVSYADRVSLEPAAVGSAAPAMRERWAALREEHKLQEYPRRDDLIDALVQDAAGYGCRFELGVVMEYPSLPQMLKAFVVEMVRGRTLLRKCGRCGRYALAGIGERCRCEQ